MSGHMETQPTRRKVKPGAIEADEQNLALVVHYELEVLGVDGAGRPTLLEQRPGEKRIKLRSLNETTNIPMLAEEIVSKCQYIPNSKLALVESILRKLQETRLSQRDTVPDSSGLPEYRRMWADRERKVEEANRRVFEQYGNARMDDVDEYMSWLYDESLEKTLRATCMIAQLARVPDNLEALVKNEGLLSALSRTLGEEARKNLDLATNILHIFSAVSHFSQLHAVLTRNGVGGVALRMIDLEVKRTQLRTEELKKRKEEMSQDEFIILERKMVLVEQKQERLLCACFQILLNLAEDPAVERKMVKRRLAHYLVEMLDRTSEELLVLVVMFLKKLSIYKQNVEDMVAYCIVEKLLPLVPCDSEVLSNITMRLLFNLSFDKSVRQQMVKLGFVPRLVELLKKPSSRPAAMRGLYQLTMEEAGRMAFRKGPGISMIAKLLVSAPDPVVNLELMALAINLVEDPVNAEMLCQGDCIDQLIRRALKTKDALLMKLLRGLTNHEAPSRSAMEPYVKPLIHAAKTAKDSNFLVEVLGCLSNFPSEGIDWAALIVDFDFLDFLRKFLVPRTTDDDILLEAVMIVGVLAGDANCTPLLSRSHVVRCLHDVFMAKQEDDEIVLQVIFDYYHLLLHASTRETLLKQDPQLPITLVDMIYDRHPALQKMADTVVDLLLDLDDEELVKKIRLRRFLVHNQEWVEATLGDTDDGARTEIADMGDMDDFDDVDDPLGGATTFAPPLFVDDLSDGEDDVE